jgi:hypothetical protein
VLFILYKAESAQRGHGKQYLKNLLKITCIRRKVLKNTIKNNNGNRQGRNNRGSAGVVHECKTKKY